MGISFRAVRAIIGLGMLAALVSACSSDKMMVDKAWMPKRIIGNIAQLEPGIYGEKYAVVEYRNGEEMRSDIVDLQFLGQIPAGDKPPYIVFSGRRCANCESNVSIYVSKPGSRLSKGSDRYRYPGRLYSHINGQLIEETRAFFGECLAGHSAGTVVWFVRSRRDGAEWQDFTVLIEVLGSGLNEETLRDPAPSIEPTLALVKQDRCREIPGRQMSSEP